MKLKALQPGLYRLAFGYVSAFLIDAGDDLVLVDCGVRGKGKAILTAITDAGLDAGRLQHILVTQLHSDHVGSLTELRSLTGAIVHAHKDEADAIENGMILRPSEPAPTLHSRLIVKYMINPNTHQRIEGCPVDRRLEDGEVLDLAGGITAIHTPGHTAGHCCYLWNRHGGILFAGDAATGGRSPGYPMLFEQQDDARASMRKLGTYEFETAHFAHGRSIGSGASVLFAKAWT